MRGFLELSDHRSFLERDLRMNEGAVAVHGCVLCIVLPCVTAF